MLRNFGSPKGVSPKSPGRSSKGAWLKRVGAKYGLIEHGRSLLRTNSEAMHEPPPSFKETYFDLRGQEFLFRSGYVEFFEDSKTLRHYGEVHQSWQTAIRNFNVGTPKNLKANSAAEREELEIFFIELRHGDPASVLSKYDSLIKNRSKDQDFLKALANTLKRRHIPNETELSLAYYILCAWLHGFLWGLGNEDRANVLHRAYGLTINSPTGDEATVVKRTIQRLKLKSWSDFRQSYVQSPFVCRLFREGEHGMCQILLRSREQNPD
jgi:hypothetical protein